MDHVSRCPVIIPTRGCHTIYKSVRSVLNQDIPVEILLDIEGKFEPLHWSQAMNVHGLGTRSHIERESLSAKWNSALKFFWKRGYDHCLVINDDVELRPDTCRILRKINGPFVTAVSVDTPEQLGPDIYSNDVDLENLRELSRPHPDFSCFMIRKEVTDRIGWFDESLYPAYTEDSDYHIRMHHAGIRAVCINLPFLHHGASTIKHADPVERRIIENGAERNRQKFKAKYGCLPGTPEYEALFA